MLINGYDEYRHLRAMAKAAYMSGDIATAMTLSHMANQAKYEMMSKSYDEAKKALDAYKQRVES